MARYSKRQLRLSDTLGRFGDKPSSHHVYNALGLLYRLRDEGSNYWDRDSLQLANWQRYCNVLLAFINSLSERRDLNKQNLETVMREYIKEFEHSRARMNQMLYGVANNIESDEGVRQINELFHWAYLASTYALVSSWIDDMQEEVSVTITINLTTGEEKEEWNRTANTCAKEI